MRNLLQTLFFIIFCCYDIAGFSQADTAILQGEVFVKTKEDTIPNSNDSITRYRLNKTFIKSFFYDAKYIATQPAWWSNKDWRNLGIVLGTTGALFFADNNIAEYMQGH